MIQQQSYATGGWGPHEHFIEPGSGALGESLNSVHASFETPCGAYAHFKLARYLLRITADPRYGDSMEQVFFNTVLGARPLQSDGSSFYYSDYTFKAKRVYYGAKWPCCSGTLPQIAADYRISAYFRSERGVYVNLYLPSTLRWNGRSAQFALRQSTAYPYDSSVRFDVTASSSAEFSVFLRIPAWAQGASLTASGMPGTHQLQAGTFAEIRRQWKNGDRIELDLPFATRLEAVDAHHPDVMALVTGPLVLMALRDGDTSREPVARTALLAAKQTTAQGHAVVGRFRRQRATHEALRRPRRCALHNLSEGDAELVWRVRSSHQNRIVILSGVCRVFAVNVVEGSAVAFPVLAGHTI